MRRFQIALKMDTAAVEKFSRVYCDAN